MNSLALTVLEYNKIIDRLKKMAMTEEGQMMADRLEPFDDVSIVRERLKETTESAELITRKGPLPTGGFYDIKRHLSMAYKGGTLTMKELLEVARDLKIAGDIVIFMKSDGLPELPVIRGMVDSIVLIPHLEGEIERCIISEDEMADNASPELKEIRRTIGKKNEEIRTKLSRFITGNEYKSYLQDAIITMREGRYVVPVKQEHSKRVPGMIHDQSKGGQTLFIEPQAVVELNNELRELELREEREIARILGELTEGVSEQGEILLSNQDLIIKLDFMMAKGKLSHDMKGEEPEIDRKGSHILKLVKARHPLIDPEKVVPIDIALGEEYSSLIVTGPNTGGKTVSLKTAGLLSLMAMSGLHIPASTTSKIPMYREIYADIGDEQSIEQSLSTFSSHMKNIVGIISNADEDSLVLLDELGAGTDPTEGAALAIAILERLKESGAYVLATTHYNEIKKYALSEDGVSNASMEFNVETLSPTYKLMMGVPGKSNAFEISGKLGLDQKIIERAGDFIERGDIEFEDVISSLSEDRIRAEEDRLEAAELVARARAREEYLSEKQAGLDARRDEILNKAREEARYIIREAKEASREAEKELQRELKNIRRTGLSQGIEGRLAEGRGRLRKLEDKYSAQTIRQINSNPVSGEDIEIGDRVKVLTLDQNGEILSLPDEKGSLIVLIGTVKINVNLDDLMLINEGKKRKPEAKLGKVRISSSKSREVSASINVRGENLADAIMDVEKYIDDVYMAGLEKVTVIHGRGEGILKEGIRETLRKNKLVASISPGVYNEGGEGVTVVTMKRGDV